MHMQAKKKEIYKTTHGSETIVSAAATCLPEFNGTFVPLDWVSTHQDSWQAYLHRISPFLASGQGAWWTQSDSGYTFFNGKADSCYNLKGPDLLHFRDSAIRAVYKRQQECWEYIIDGNIEFTYNISQTIYNRWGIHINPQYMFPPLVITLQFNVFPLPVSIHKWKVFPLQ